MNIKIGAKIKALRKRNDITQERLAEVLGVTSQAISKWESESGYPDIEYITPIANFFNVTTDYLFDHDTAEKQKKIDTYCEQFDINYRNYGKNSPQERVDMMRQALAEFPAEEKLLVRLANALYDKWHSYGTVSNCVDGKIIPDYEKHKSFDSWEEAVKIFEELLATSFDDSIRSKCRVHLADIYSRIGEKEKVLAIAEKCDNMSACKENILADMLGRVGSGERVYDQKRLISLLDILWSSFYKLCFTINYNERIETLNIIINFYKFIFSDGNYGQYNTYLTEFYKFYAGVLLSQNKSDEAFEALENAYNHTKMSDIYVKKLRKEGRFKYTSPFVNMLEDISDDVIISSEHMALFLKTLKDKREWGKIHDDPRYTALINRIEVDIAEL